MADRKNCAAEEKEISAATGSSAVALIIPGRIGEWSKKIPRLGELAGSVYGELLVKAYGELKTDILYISDGHGIGHIERTMLFGALIAMNENLSEKDTVMLLRCCSYHDIARVDDRYDEEHGIRSADRILSCELKELFDDPAVAAAAIGAHAVPDSQGDRMIEKYGVADVDRFHLIMSCLKDADNLDRVRIGDFDSRFLRHEESVKMGDLAEWVFYEYEKVPTILCFGDSNTYGYNPNNGGRYPPYVRWTDGLQHRLGSRYKVIPEGLSGRTTAFALDGIPWKSGLLVIEAVLGTNYPIDNLIIMLGVNDCSASLNLSSDEITGGLEKLIIAARTFLVEHQGYYPKILILAEPRLNENTLTGIFKDSVNRKSLETSAELAGKFAALADRLGCDFMDLEGKVSFSPLDGSHLTTDSHFRLGKILSEYFN